MVMAAINTATDIKQERINLRLRNEAKMLLERAASFEGKSVSAFILGSALARAESTIQTHETMHLNAGDAAAFFAALDRPVQFSPALSAALVEHGERVISL